MLGVSGAVLFINHLVACFWYLGAKLDNFGPDTWVVRAGLTNSTVGMQWIAAYYWAF